MEIEFKRNEYYIFRNMILEFYETRKLDLLDDIMLYYLNASATSEELHLLYDTLYYDKDEIFHDIKWKEWLKLKK